MAESQTTVELIFQGVDKTTEATQAALKNLRGFSDDLQKVTGPLAGATDAIIKFETAIVGMGVAVTAFSIYRAAELENATISLAKVLDDTDPSMEVFIEHAREMAYEYGEATISVLGSLTSFKQAGFEAEEAFMLTRAALDMVIAGEVELTSSSTLLVAAIRGFGASADDAKTIVDLLNAASNQYAVTFEQLLVGYSRFSPIANAANLSFEEALGIMVPIVEVFQSGEIAATALNSSLLKLQSDNSSVVEALKELKISQYDANGELKSAGEIYFEVAEALQTVDDNQRTYYAQQLVGINQSAKFLAAVEGLNITLHIAGDEFNYAGSAAREVGIALESTERSIDRAKVAFTEIFTSIGQPLLDGAKDIADGLNAIFQAIGDSVRDPEQLGSLVLFVQDVLRDIGAALESAALNLPEAFKLIDYDGIIASFEYLTDSLAGLFEKWDLDTPEGLADAMQGLFIVFERITFIAADIIKTFQWIFDAIGEANPEVLRFGENWDGVLASVLGFGKQADVLLGNLSSLSKILEALVGILTLKAGANLLSSLGLTTGGMTALATKAGITATGLGATGLVAAAGGAGFALGTLINEVTGASDWLADMAWKVREVIVGQEDWTSSTGELTAEQIELAKQVRASALAAEELAAKDAEFDRLWDVVTSGGQAFDTVEEAMENLADGQKVFFDESTNKWLVLGGAVEEFGGTFSGIEDIFDITQKRLDALGTTVEENGKIWKYAQDAAGNFFYELVTGTEDANDRTKQWIETTVDGVTTFEQAGGSVTSSLKAQEEAAKDAFEQTDAYFLKLMELASNEKIALIEAKVKLDVAQIEADVRKVESAFESLNTGIMSTGETLTNLFTLLLSFDGSLLSETGMMLKDAILSEQKYRDDQFELQKELINAQIDALKARTDALNRGEALIQVDGAGLQPHLEAFMWEILRAIQMRVNEDGLEMLLGV